MTLSGIKPATCRFVAQCLNHYATARPTYIYIYVCVCVYIYIYLFIYIHTRISTSDRGGTYRFRVDQLYKHFCFFLTDSYATRRKKSSGTTSRGKRPRPVLHRGTQLPHKGQSESLRQQIRQQLNAVEFDITNSTAVLRNHYVIFKWFAIFKSICVL